jgi:enediyne polyketide synthase
LPVSNASLGKIVDLIQLMETSLEDANIVGNIYFANYYAWQGRVRDRYFYDLIPEYFQGTGDRGN